MGIGKIFKKVFLPTEHVKDTGKALGLNKKKKAEATPPAPETATVTGDQKPDTSQVASLQAEIAQLKETINRLKAPGTAISSPAYNLEAQRAALGMSPGLRAEPAFRIRGT